MFDVAVEVTLPARVVSGQLPSPPRGRTVVVGVGKASARTARFDRRGVRRVICPTCKWSVRPGSRRSEATHPVSNECWLTWKAARPAFPGRHGLEGVAGSRALRRQLIIMVFCFTSPVGAPGRRVGAPIPLPSSRSERLVFSQFRRRLCSKPYRTAVERCPLLRPAALVVRGPDGRGERGRHRRSRAACSLTPAGAAGRVSGAARRQPRLRLSPGCRALERASTIALPRRVIALWKLLPTFTGDMIDSAERPPVCSATVGGPAVKVRTKATSSDCPALPRSAACATMRARSTSTWAVLRHAPALPIRPAPPRSYPGPSALRGHVRPHTNWSVLPNISDTGYQSWMQNGY